MPPVTIGSPSGGRRCQGLTELEEWKKRQLHGGSKTVLLAMMSLLSIAVLGVIAGTAMTSSTTVFVAALTLSMVFAVVLALVLETVDVADEPQNERRR